MSYLLCLGLSEVGFLGGVLPDEYPDEYPDE